MYTPQTTTLCHLHAACAKEKPPGTCATTTEWTALPVLGSFAFDLGSVATTDESVLLPVLVLGAPELLLSFRRRLLAGAAADNVDSVDSEEAARRLKARVDISLTHALVLPAHRGTDCGTVPQKN